MSTSRRTFLLGTAAAAVAPVLPAIASAISCEHQGVIYSVAADAQNTIIGSPLYGRSPAMLAVETIRTFEKLEFEREVWRDALNEVMQHVISEQADCEA